MAEQGIIFDVKEFTLHDGPGIRTTVFLKGCPLRCVWCHNPEGLAPEPQLMVAGDCDRCGDCMRGCSHPECAPWGRCLRVCRKGIPRVAGEEADAGELAKRLKRQASLLVEGGVTLSGGEPLMQPAFLLDLLTQLKPLHTVVQTSGFADGDVLLAAAQACDQVYLDIKLADSRQHRELTGAGNDRILANLWRLAAVGKPFVVRVPLIPGLTDTAENLAAIARLLAGIPALERVDLMPYNPYAPVKYAWLEREYKAGDLAEQPVATQEALDIFTARSLPCQLL